MNACSKDERSVGADDEDGKNLSSRLAEMAAAVEARDAFLAVAAHELRNPITPLVGQVDLLLAGVKSRKYSIEQVEKHLERIQHILSRYVRRASVLLDVSRMTTDKLLLYPEPCDLATLLRDLVDIIQRLVPSFDGGDNLVRVLCPSERPWVGVGLGQEPVDRGLKFDDRAKYSSFEPPLGQLGEKPFDRVEPGG
jgi:signal transduction histidine kinase